MNEEQYMGFESYINNEMPQEEKILFEEKLQNDIKFKESFDLYKETTKFIEIKFSRETTSFRENLKSISQNHFETISSSKNKTKSKVIKFKPWHYSIAASIALFFGIFIFMQNGNPEYSDYNQHENAAFTERGSIIKNLRLAQDAFNKKEYKVAIENFEIVLKEYDKPEIRFFYAIALLEENHFAEAETNFINLQKGTTVYKDKATWNLALSKLKQKQYKECKAYLDQLPVDADDYEKAQKLLKELD